MESENDKNAKPPRTRAEQAKSNGGYLKKPNDWITAREAVLLIDSRVSVLLAHWEYERRLREAENRWYRRLHRRWLALLERLRRPDTRKDVPPEAPASST